MDTRRAAGLALTLDCSEVDSGEELTARLSTIARNTEVGEIVLLQNIGVLAGRSPILVLSPSDRSVVVRGRLLSLPRREFEVLAALAHRGGTLSRTLLGELVWPALPSRAAADFAKVYIRRLRRRLGHDADVLATTAAGYRLARPFRILPT